MGAGAVEEMIAQGRVVAREQARLLELVLQVAGAADDPRFGVDEVAFAMTWTKATADAQEGLARQLICGLPEVFAALCSGDIDVPKARVFVDVLQALESRVAQRVAALVLPVAADKTTAQLRGMLHRRALAADPEHARKRREEGVRQRRVIVEPAPDGTARLTALGLPPDRAQAAFERVTAIAKARKVSGATATLDQLRADALLDLLDGTAIDVTPGPRRGVVELIVGLQTLAGLDEEPGLLNGFGPVAADIARQCAAANLGAQWRFSVIDPDSGQLLFHNITRARPTPAQARPTRNRTRRTPTQPAPRPPRTPAASGQARPVPTPPTSSPPRTSTRPAPTEPEPRTPAPSPARVPAASAQARPVPIPARVPAAPAQTRPVPSPARVPAASAQTRPVPSPQRTSAWSGQTGQTPSQPVPCPPEQDPHARFPNAAMTAWIRARDRTCRAPGCRIPARACHLDHTTDYARGGLTTHDDLGSVCSHHHGMKHEGGWRLYQIQPGHFVWISPANRIYHVRPEPP